MNFGDKLKAWRKAKGMTQPELAGACGVNVSYISNLERNFSASTKSGKPRPSEALTEKLAKVLGVPIDETRLAAGYAPKSETKVPTKILTAYAKSGHLSERDEDLVAAFIETLERQRKEESEK